MRRLSCLSVPMMCRPPVLSTLSLSRAQISSASRRAASRCSSAAWAGSTPSRRRTSLLISWGLPPSRMSTPRPAMLVAMVSAPGRPAWAMMCASISWYLALRTR